MLITNLANFGGNKTTVARTTTIVSSIVYAVAALTAVSFLIDLKRKRNEGIEWKPGVKEVIIAAVFGVIGAFIALIVYMVIVNLFLAVSGPDTFRSDLQGWSLLFSGFVSGFLAKLGSKRS